VLQVRVIEPGQRLQGDWSIGTGRLFSFRASWASSDLVHEAILRDQEELNGASTARDVVVSAHSQKWTDARARLLRELLGTMQIIKVFTYEIPFLKRKQ
jgi:hypothetical protein